MNRLLVMAGGTGGHVFPGLAVAEQMKAHGWQVEWMGTADRMEAELVPKHGFKIHFIEVQGLRRKGLMTKVFAVLHLIKAVFSAISILRAYRPQVVLGMGGYASGPGGLAAFLLRIPLVVHEQNAVFGMTNRLLCKVAKYCLTGFDFSHTSDKPEIPQEAIFTGNPIRKDFFNIPPLALTPLKQEDVAKNEIAKDISKTLNILIVGGSLGALALNQRLPELLAKARSSFSNNIHLKVKHQAGKGKLNDVEAAYQALNEKAEGLDEAQISFEVTEFIDDVVEAFEWSDIVICRAGALTVAEVAASGRPAIFIPLPSAVDDHQTANAKALERKEAGFVVQQASLDEKFLDIFHLLCLNDTTRVSVGNNARLCAHYNASQKIASILDQFNTTPSPSPSHQHEHDRNQDDRHSS